MTVRALLFTDLVDSTAHIEQLGDERAARVLAEHDRCARELLAREGGREIDRTDGFFLMFDTVICALRFAMAYHASLVPLQLSARAGLHAGEVTLHVNAPADVARGAKPLEVEGLAKPLAARVMGLARGGQTLISDAAMHAMEQPSGGPDAALQIERLGHYRLKGIADPVLLHGVAQGPPGALEPPSDTDKAYRVMQVEGLWLPVREVRHNLPAERDAFIGRSTELHALAQRLASGTRLLTVLGVGGTGKTRMVRRYALSWLGEWPGGVAFCDLSEARSLEGICFAVAMALELPLGKDDPVRQLGHAIAARGRCLLILDNFEQITALAPATLDHWLNRAPEASFVVTSRERLHIAGEELYPVEPLTLHTDALALFEVRARAQRAAFRLDDGNRDAVSKVVQLLDGLPLAIELAAARVRVLSPAQILERLKNRFVLLAGARGAAARQATLRAAIDWSWDLLEPFEQAALAQCSVFEGGFTLEAAEAVLDLSAWPGSPPTMDAVQSLVDKSLLRAWLPTEQARLDIDEPYFGMYLSVHEYAADKLSDRGADALVHAQRRHGLHFAQWGSDKAVDSLYADGSKRARGALAQEVDNLAAACRRALERADAQVALPTYRAICEVLGLQGPFSLAISLGPSVLNLPGSTDAPRLDASIALANALFRSGRIDEARQVLGSALVAARSVGEKKREGLALAQLANLDREQGHMDTARLQMDAALAVHREAGNLRGQAGVLQNLGNLNDQQGLPAASRDCHQQALALYQQLGDQHGIAQVHGSLGILNRHTGQMDAARQHYAAALTIHREIGDRRSQGMVLGNLANLLLDQGHVEEARQHLEAALIIHRQVGSRVIEAFAVSGLGLVLQQQGQLVQARAHHELALAITREVGNRFHEGYLQGVLGNMAMEEGRLDDARLHLEQALAISRAGTNRLVTGTTLGSLGELARRQQRLEDALGHLNEAERTLREVDNPFELAHVLCSQARAAIDAGDPALAHTAIAEARVIATAIAATADSVLLREVDEIAAKLG